MGEDRAQRRVLVGGASDERLVALARAGDEQAFAAIVERYRGPLLRYCHRFLAPSAAEDALQQTFINAYAALSGDTARTPISLRPWLYRVAHNAALNVARDPQAGHDPLPEGLDGVERPDEVVQRRERLRRVVGAVSALPPRQRHIIARQLDGESHERIASDLGVSAGSIRQLAHRARRTVRDAAAALFPTPLLRLLPLGDTPVAGGALAKVAVAAVVAGAAGGGAVEVARHDASRSQRRETVTVARDRAQTPPATRAAAASPTGVARIVPGGVVSVPRGSRHRGSGDDGSASAGSDSSGRGSGGSSESGSSEGGSSGPGSSGSGSSGSGSSGSGTSGSGSSGSGTSGSGTSGSGTSGSGTSGRGSSGSGSSGSGSSGGGSSGGGSSESSSPAVVPTPTADSSGGSGSGSGSG